MRELLRFTSESSLEELLENKDSLVVYCIVNSILWGFDNKLDQVDCFELEKPNSIVTFKMEKSEWLDCLETTLKDMINYEDYEMCIKIKEAISKL